MQSRWLAVVVGLVSLAAACSRGKPKDAPNLDLMLPDYTGPARVASSLEIWGKDKPAAAAPTQSSAATAPRHAPRRTPARHHPPRLVHAPARAPVLGKVAAAPAPVPTPAPEPAAVPTPDPGPQQTTQPQQGHGLGGLGGILRGIGGVIILRGGYGGMDPCDERGHHGMGRGMPMPGPMPTPWPGRGGRGPNGVVYLSGR